MPSKQQIAQSSDRTIGSSRDYPETSLAYDKLRGDYAAGLDLQATEMAYRAYAFLMFKRQTPFGDIKAMPALINPETLQEKVKASYSKGNVLGLSHQSIQYIFTESRTIPIELHISSGILEQKNWIDLIPDLLQWKRFFQSLVVPAGLGLAPPTVRVIWPKVKLAFQGVVESLDITYEQFAPNGRPIAYSLSMEFLETASRLMTSDRVLQQGLGRKAYGD